MQFFFRIKRYEKIEKCEIDDATSFLPASEWRADSMHTLFQNWFFIRKLDFWKMAEKYSQTEIEVIFGAKIQTKIWRIIWVEMIFWTNYWLLVQCAYCSVGI